MPDTAEETAQQQQRPNAIVHLPLELVHPSPTNPRRYIDLMKVDELAANIRAIGQLEPIIVRPVRRVVLELEGNASREAFMTRAHLENWDMAGRPRDIVAFGVSEDLDHYEIAAGERRWRAISQLAEEQAVPETIAAIVRELTDEEMLDIQVSENLQREDLTALDWAAAYAAMVEVERQKDLSHKEAVRAVAERLGKSTSFVYQTMQLSKLCDEGQQALRRGWISKNHGIDCARLAPQQQMEYLCECFNAWGSELRDCLESGEEPEMISSVRSMREWMEVKGYREREEDGGGIPAEAPDEGTDNGAQMSIDAPGEHYGPAEEAEEELRDFPAPVAAPASKPPSPAPRVDVNSEADRKRHEEDRGVVHAAIKKMLTASHAAAKKAGLQMVPGDLRVVARSLFMSAFESGHDVQIAAALRWEYDSERMTLRSEADNFIKSRLAVMEADLLPRFLLLCAMLGGEADYACVESDLFGDVQSRYRIDLGAIRAELRGENKAAGAARAKAPSQIVKTKTGVRVNKLPAKAKLQSKSAKSKSAPRAQKKPAKAKKAKGRSA